MIFIILSIDFTLFLCIFVQKCSKVIYFLCFQLGCVVAGPEGRGGVHDHRHGRQPVSSGAALHLLHLFEKVSAGGISFAWYLLKFP